MPLLSDIAEEARLTALSLADYASDIVDPTVRLGVTGLSRAGKTVFITSLVHNLTKGGRLPLFSAFSSGRIASAALRPQPDDAVPRFDYETHLAALTGGGDVETRHWPDSTRHISELRIALNFESETFFGRNLGRGTLNLDIVDYPGEWLLDLSLLELTYAQWSAKAVAQSRTKGRSKIAAPFHALLKTLDPAADENETQAREAAAAFTSYLRAAREERYALSALPPGRFLMPGDLEGSPALTFAPLDIAPDARAVRGSLHAMMERRYEAYLSTLVRPFFRDHFARLDRQIVLVDLLQALNAGPSAVSDLETALADILSAFRPGRNSWLSRILARRVDKIVFAATKADHLHHTNHDRLEALLAHIAGRAISRADFAGAATDVVALASVRATREATVNRGGDALDCIVGVPQEGQTVAGETYDGKTEIALFPGDLPNDPRKVMADPTHALSAPEGVSEAEWEAFRFLRFRPPLLNGPNDVLPHIRLDRVLEFLLSDRLA
ncbi:YcjX family protein [Tepidamorphus sp. 3E244]|uniref:YcjX family protein n=1 Tax=Tepidamorphus sp. 3E244 TaxID=3385498 RepID=UPI0038FD0973